MPAHDMGRILLVSWTLPPSLAGSATVVANLAAHFDESELVVAGEAAAKVTSSSPDASRLPRVRYVAREWTWPRRGRRFVWWTRWASLPLVTRRLEKIAREEQCDSVIAVFPNEFYLLAAYMVAKRGGLRFFPYFHNTYLENRSGLGRSLAEWLQPRVFKDAEAVFTISDGLRDFLARRHPGVKFVSLRHGFDGPVVEPEVPPVHAPLRLAFLGNLNDSNIEAMQRLGRVIGTFPCELTVISGTPAWFWAKCGIAGKNIRHENVGHDELLAKLRDHDVLLLPHGLGGRLSEAEYETIFPTRTVTYLASGRPILAHAPEGSFLARFLRDRDCAEVVTTPDEGALRHALERLSEDPRRRERLVANALRAVEPFRGNRVTGELRRVLEMLPRA